MTEHPAPTTPRERWLAERRGGIGGTDAPAILGVSPFKKPIDVWADKRGLKRPTPPNDYMYWGTKIEPLIIQRYTEDTGIKTYKPEAILTHPKHPILLGNPDGICINTPKPRGLEVKTASTYGGDEWGAEGTDEVPVSYALQCAHYMMITGFSEWDLAVLIGGQDFRIYHLRRDLELEQMMMERLLNWWQRFVVGDEEPPVDLDSASLATRWPEQRLPLIEAPPEAETLAFDLAMARRDEEEAAARRELLENSLKLVIADHEGVKGKGWKVTWRKTADTVKVDWQKVAQFLGADDPEKLLKLTEQFSVEKQGVRRFLFKIDADAKPALPSSKAVQALPAGEEQR